MAAHKLIVNVGKSNKIIKFGVNVITLLNTYVLSDVFHIGAVLKWK